MLRIYVLLCISKYFYKMKSDSKSIEDIKAIRKMMEESYNVIALAGALVAYFFILKAPEAL